MSVLVPDWWLDEIEAEARRKQFSARLGLAALVVSTVLAMASVSWVEHQDKSRLDTLEQCEVSDG